jgi:hypothetical protein
MPDVKISALPSGTANATAVVPATNAAGTTTQKVTLGSIRDLPHTHAIVDVTGLQTALDGKQASGSYLTSVPDGSITDAKIDAAGLSASSVNWVGVTAWAASTTYAKGALVHYLGITYRRSVAGTTGATFNSANWQQMTAPVNVVVTPAQLTGNANDYALGGHLATGDIFRVSSSSAVNITGISAGLYDGHAILLRNVGTFNITLTHQDAASAAANRMISPWAGNVVISANSSMLLVYDSTLSRWVVT